MLCMGWILGNTPLGGPWHGCPRPSAVPKLGSSLGQHSLEHPGNCLPGPTFNSVGRRSWDLVIVGSIHHTAMSSYFLLLVGGTTFGAQG